MEDKTILKEQAVEDITGGMGDTASTQFSHKSCPMCGSFAVRQISTRKEGPYTIGTYRCLMCGAKFQEQL